MGLLGLLKKAERLISDNSPLLLTAIGVTGTITTAYFAGKASFKAAELLQEEKIKAMSQTGDMHFKFTDKEKAKIIWPLYIPAIGTGVLTVVCVIAANRIGTRRAAAMAAAFQLSERAFAEYKEKVVEKLGDHKEQRLRDEIAQERVTRNPPSSKEVILVGTGEVLCYDSITGRYFNSNMESLKKAQNDVNLQLINEFSASLNDFYTLIKLPGTPYADEVGWNINSPLELKFSTVMSENDRPCISLEYKVFPIREYFRVQ